MMALLHINRRLFRNSFLATVVLLSVCSFIIFTTYTSDNLDLSSKLRIKSTKDSELVYNLAQNIKFVQEKIKINNLNRSSAASLQKIALAVRQMEENVNGNLDKDAERETSLLTMKPNYNVHIFYYPWYKNEKIDGSYAHWNHELLPHWNDKSLTQKQHVPPDDIGANYYPKLGPYSSSDPVIIDAHMKQIRTTGAGVLSVSWYPPNYLGKRETSVDNLMMKLLDAAVTYELKIAFHLEPFSNRSGQTLREVVKYVIDKYGNHPAFYRLESEGRQLPVFYVYDSYQIKPQLWADALIKNGKFSIRNTPYDAIFLGLLVEFEHLQHLSQSGFDGFYTYFASNGFVYGSTWKNWPKISVEAKERKLIFVPSIGPGYLDTRVRSWNRENTKLRLNGGYYKSAFKAALAVKPALLTITSFNEWHEGSQIEPAIPKTITDFKYEDYQPNSPEFYLNLTRIFVEEYRKMTFSMQSHEFVDNL